MNYLQRENLRLFLAWQEKYRRCYVEPDPWPEMAMGFFDRELNAKRRAARAWLAEESERWKKKAPPGGVVGIWAARNWATRNTTTKRTKRW